MLPFVLQVPNTIALNEKLGYPDFYKIDGAPEVRLSADTLKRGYEFEPALNDLPEFSVSSDVRKSIGLLGERLAPRTSDASFPVFSRIPIESEIEIPPLRAMTRQETAMWCLDFLNNEPLSRLSQSVPNQFTVDKVTSWCCRHDVSRERATWLCRVVCLAKFPSSRYTARERTLSWSRFQCDFLEQLLLQVDSDARDTTVPATRTPEDAWEYGCALATHMLDEQLMDLDYFYTWIARTYEEVIFRLVFRRGVRVSKSLSVSIPPLLSRRDAPVQSGAPMKSPESTKATSGAATQSVIGTGGRWVGSAVTKQRDPKWDSVTPTHVVLLQGLILLCADGILGNKPGFSSLVSACHTLLSHPAWLSLAWAGPVPGSTVPGCKPPVANAASPVPCDCVGSHSAGRLVRSVAARAAHRSAVSVLQLLMIRLSQSKLRSLIPLPDVFLPCLLETLHAVTLLPPPAVRVPQARLAGVSSLWLRSLLSPPVHRRAVSPLPFKRGVTPPPAAPGSNMPPKASATPVAAGNPAAGNKAGAPTPVSSDSPKGSSLRGHATGSGVSKSDSGTSVAGREEAGASGSEILEGKIEYLLARGYAKVSSTFWRRVCARAIDGQDRGKDGGSGKAFERAYAVPSVSMPCDGLYSPPLTTAPLNLPLWAYSSRDFLQLDRLCATASFSDAYAWVFSGFRSGHVAGGLNPQGVLLLCEWACRFRHSPSWCPSTGWWAHDTGCSNGSPSKAAFYGESAGAAPQPLSVMVEMYPHDSWRISAVLALLSTHLHRAAHTAYCSHVLSTGASPVARSSFGPTFPLSGVDGHSGAGESSATTRRGPPSAMEGGGEGVREILFPGESVCVALPNKRGMLQPSRRSSGMLLACEACSACVPLFDETAEPADPHWGCHGDEIDGTHPCPVAGVCPEDLPSCRDRRVSLQDSNSRPRCCRLTPVRIKRTCATTMEAEAKGNSGTISSGLMTNLVTADGENATRLSSACPDDNLSADSFPDLVAKFLVWSVPSFESMSSARAAEDDVALLVCRLCERGLLDLATLKAAVHALTESSKETYTLNFLSRIARVLDTSIITLSEDEENAVRIGWEFVRKGGRDSKRKLEQLRALPVLTRFVVSHAVQRRLAHVVSFALKNTCTGGKEPSIPDSVNPVATFSLARGPTGSAASLHWHFEDVDLSRATRLFVSIGDIEAASMLLVTSVRDAGANAGSGWWTNVWQWLDRLLPVLKLDIPLLTAAIQAACWKHASDPTQPHSHTLSQAGTRSVSSLSLPKCYGVSVAVDFLLKCAQHSSVAYELVSAKASPVLWDTICDKMHASEQLRDPLFVLESIPLPSDMEDISPTSTMHKASSRPVASDPPMSAASVPSSSVGGSEERSTDPWLWFETLRGSMGRKRGAVSQKESGTSEERARERTSGVGAGTGGQVAGDDGIVLLGPSSCMSDSRTDVPLTIINKRRRFL
eukprot:Rmarinus@m.9235